MSRDPQQTPNSIMLSCEHLSLPVVQLAQRKIQEILTQVRRQQQPKPAPGAQPPPSPQEVKVQRNWRDGDWICQKTRQMDRCSRVQEEKTRGRLCSSQGFEGYHQLKHPPPTCLLLDVLSSVALKETARLFTSTPPPRLSASLWECTSEGSQRRHLPSRVRTPDRSPPPPTGV